MIRKEYKDKNDHIIWEVPTEELALKCDKWGILNTSPDDTYVEWDNLDDELLKYQTFNKFTV